MPDGHVVHESAVDAVEYLPTAHVEQMLAPVLAPVFVIDPGAQSMQSLALFEPDVSTYFPAIQPVHVVTLEVVEYLPAAHAVHLVAPALPPLSVIEPAAQTVQDGTFEAVEYSPASHSVHERAPAAVPVFVIDPT